MKSIWSLPLAVIFIVGCNAKIFQPPRETVSLAEARRGFQTRLVSTARENDPAPRPPANLFRLVRYDSPVGKLAAYLSVKPRDNKKHPAIIWIFGGFSNSIGETAWERQPPSNDQSASAFRDAGIVMMYPSFRGGNDNPGAKEGFFGEVDDLLAAAEFLAKQDFVDPERIYLGGHSTGGTMALLAAESSDRFRAVFAFGPAEDVAGYGPENLPFDLSNKRELELRAPVRWLHSIHQPTFVFEGTARGNIDSLHDLQRAAADNAAVKCFPINGGTHFSILAPLTRVAAAKIQGDAGPSCNISFSEQELSLK